MVGGSYYFNVGCSDLIADGKIGLLKYPLLDRITESGITLQDGTHLDFDLIVMATGYENLQHSVARLVNPRIAEKIGPVWGFENGELRNMYGPTPQKGLWFTGGSFAQCRIWSRFLANQIKAREGGLV